MTAHNRDYEYGIDSWGNEDPDQLQDASEFGGIDDYDIDRWSREADEEDERALEDLKRKEEEEAEEAEAELIAWQKWNQFQMEAYGPNAARSWGNWSKNDDEIVLYFWHGKTTEEIAEKIGRAPRAVRARVYFLCVEALGITPHHRDGCIDGKVSEMTAPEIESLYWRFVSRASQQSLSFRNASNFILEFIDDQICEVTVAKVLALAGHLSPVNLDLVTYYHPSANSLHYKEGMWTAEEVSWLESNCGWALLEQMVERLSRSPIDIIRQLNVLGLVTNDDFERLLFEIRMFE